MNKEFEEWLSTRPKVIQDLARKYPLGEYVIKAGAPYGISCPGTKVQMFSYHENGTVSVIVLARDKTPQGISHEKYLSDKFGKNIDESIEADVKVNIDPKWMEPVKITA